MAEIVLGIGTSHGPMLVTETEIWGARVPNDKVSVHAWRNGDWTYDQLVEARAGEGLAAQITREVWDERQARCQANIEQLADIFADARVDIAVIVGNDQNEIYRNSLNPAFAVHYGDTITNYEFTPERMKEVPPGVEKSLPGYIPAGGAEYPGCPELALRIIGQAIADEFDVAAMNAMPRPETPHAWGFVYRRIMRDNPCPSVMVTVNTFFPPNQPTVRRCYKFGQSILQAIREWDSDKRVALIASGGLTHFVIDEAVDRTFLDGLANKQFEPVFALGEDIFRDGTSEMKNWVPVAGAMAQLGLEPHVMDYIPCYRSEAGTGNAMGFVYWR
ncbi:protocatechuate 3,4-dioxygenase [Sphingomonas canadensis]|uniref:Protocatechuate 3,4-dioxygenase n=1 Tax=Sphingomonas canadensis TaxID=1219257 RepID=A0ABW3HEH4_9SPHN|nr:protocatechuate 3,4-dioxygenase [Sphingomonas canadensis]MCW3838333.1 protocatechuate 3,4-dioxygenase [Sphingomonas canadensis]